MRRRKNKAARGAVKVLTASALAAVLAAGTISAYAAEGVEWIAVGERQFKIDYLLENQEYAEGLLVSFNAAEPALAQIAQAAPALPGGAAADRPAGLTQDQQLQIQRWANLGMHDEAVALRLDTSDNFELIQSADEVLSGEFSGTVILNVPGVQMDGAVIRGDLIVTEAVGDGDIFLNDVELYGVLFVRAGGTESIHITGRSIIRNIEIYKAVDDAEVAIRIGEGARVETIVASNGGLNVVGIGGYEPTVTRIEVGDGATVVVDASVSVNALEIVGNDVTVVVHGAVENLVVIGESAQVEVASGAVVATKTVQGDSAQITVAGGAVVETKTIQGNGAQITIAEGAVVETKTVQGDGAQITIAEGALIETLIVSGMDAAVDNQGTVSALEITNEALGSLEWAGVEAEVETITVETPEAPAVPAPALPAPALPAPPEGDTYEPAPVLPIPPAPPTPPEPDPGPPYLPYEE